jgi:hypothetical protein
MNFAYNMAFCCINIYNCNVIVVLIIYSYKLFIYSFTYLFCGYWGLNPGPCTCCANTLLLVISFQLYKLQFIIIINYNYNACYSCINNKI